MTSMVCPRCSAEHWQRQEWKPDADPTRYRRQCYVCGWKSGWKTWPLPVQEKANARAYWAREVAA